MERLVPLVIATVAHAAESGRHAGAHADAAREHQPARGLSGAAAAVSANASNAARAGERQPVGGALSDAATRSCSTNCSMRARCTPPPVWRSSDAGCAAGSTTRADDTERQMDVLRHFKHAQTLRLLAQDLAGELPLERLSDHLSDAGRPDTVPKCCAIWRGLRTPPPRRAALRRHRLRQAGRQGTGLCVRPRPRFPVRRRRRPRPRRTMRGSPAHQHLAHQHDPAGLLYETDLRLRPNGASGLLVSSLDGFRRIPAQGRLGMGTSGADACALRAPATPPSAAAFDAIRIEVLRQPRDCGRCATKSSPCARKCTTPIPTPAGWFDIKHDRGGIVDVEFIVQYLVLGYAHQHAGLTGNIGNLALLPAGRAARTHRRRRCARRARRLPPLRQLQHALRLQGDKYARVDAATLAPEIAAVKNLWNGVLCAAPVRTEPPP